MGVITFNKEFTSIVEANRMFKACILDSHNLYPKLLPQAIKSIELLSGDGGVGTISQTNFAEGNPVKYIKYKIEALDKDNYYCKYTSFEGGWIGEKLEKVEYEVKVNPKPDGKGCACKLTTCYYPLKGGELDKEEVNGWDDQSIGFYQVVADHLLANPTVYA